MGQSLINLPAEWYPQSGVQLTWPHELTDWHEMLQEVETCFVDIACSVLKYEKLLVICGSKDHVLSLIPSDLHFNLRLFEINSNDTWARDHGALTVLKDNRPTLLDFKFNGWGLKFASDQDNFITIQLFQKNCFADNVEYENHLGFVLEGGSLESDGKGTILTTSECLLSPYRNGNLSQEQIEHFLINEFGAKQVLWLNHGYIIGDDTDSHIDTLARFCDEETIAYVKCTDENEEHYKVLLAMENELKSFKTLAGKPYRLVPMPMAEPVYFNNQRLPATYANFLIINGAVLVPAYGSNKDRDVEIIMRNLFPNRKIIMIDCLPLIKQHGSLHCVTMQYPEGLIK